MRTFTITLMALVASTLVACDEDTESTFENPNAEETADNGDLKALWVNIEAGHCQVYYLDPATGAERGPEIVTVRDSVEAVLVTGQPGESIEVKCDGDVLFPTLPAVTIDPDGFPQVYCNPHGDSWRPSGEHESCAGDFGSGTRDLWVYVHPDGNPKTSGPRDLTGE